MVSESRDKWDQASLQIANCGKKAHIVCVGVGWDQTHAAGSRRVGNARLSLQSEWGFIEGQIDGLTDGQTDTQTAFREIEKYLSFSPLNKISGSTICQHLLSKSNSAKKEKGIELGLSAESRVPTDSK